MTEIIGWYHIAVPASNKIVVINTARPNAFNIR